MKQFVLGLLLLLGLLPAPRAHALGGKNDMGLETGIVWPSPWLAVRSASTAFGHAAGEFVDLTAGTIQDGKKTQGAFSSTYYLSDGKAGFGVAAEYLRIAGAGDHLLSRAGAGLGTDLVQAGFNFEMDATVWSFAHELSVRAGKADGFAVALLTPDISSITTEFTLGIGYSRKGLMALEMDCPLNTDNMLSRPRIELLHPTVSATFQAHPKVTINGGVNSINLNEKGGSVGEFHAGILWWSSDAFGLVFTLNKRYVFSLGITGRP